MKKPKPQSTQAPSCTTFLHKAFSLFQHHLKFLKTPLLMKTKKISEAKIHLNEKI
jgi:hypothetical protein